MKREKLNEYIGQNVRITFFDGDVREGTLGYTPEFSSKYGYRKPKCYTIGNLDFKLSHVTSIYKI